jgi:3',5'-cyclic AMP phosphodiesterase CpdA
MVKSGIKFAQISDIHLMVEERCRCWWMSAAPDKLLQQAIAQLQAIPDLDFVVFTGDLVDRADRASFEQFREIVSPLRVPYFCSVGNHDIATGRTACPQRFDRQQFVDWCRQQFSLQAASTGWADYSSSPIAGVRLIALDTSLGEWPEPQGMIRREQLEWLRAELAACPQEIVVIAIHQPPLASVLFRDYRLLPHYSRQLRRVLHSHPHVVAVLSGHLHTPKVYTRRHTTYLTAPPLVGPVSAFRLFELKVLPERAVRLPERWGVLRYDWYRVQLPEQEVKPLWHAIAMGRRSDRWGQTLVPLPPQWGKLQPLERSGELPSRAS